MNQTVNLYTGANKQTNHPNPTKLNREERGFSEKSIGDLEKIRSNLEVQYEEAKNSNNCEMESRAFNALEDVKSALGNKRVEKVEEELEQSDVSYTSDVKLDDLAEFEVETDKYSVFMQVSEDGIKAIAYDGTVAREAMRDHQGDDIMHAVKSYERTGSMARGQDPGVSESQVKIGMKRALPVVGPIAYSDIEDGDYGGFRDKMKKSLDALGVNAVNIDPENVGDRIEGMEPSETYSPAE